MGGNEDISEREHQALHRPRLSMQLGAKAVRFSFTTALDMSKDELWLDEGLPSERPGLKHPRWEVCIIRMGINLV